MGLLSEGRPLGWFDQGADAAREKVKRDGVLQFIHAYRRLRGRTGDALKWGDEVEYTLVKCDERIATVHLSLRGPEVIGELVKEEKVKEVVETLWRPECANWMVEGTPGLPYRCYAGDLDLVERNMSLRRKQIAKLLRDDEFVLTIPAFPRLGCVGFLGPNIDLVIGKYSRSLYIPDNVINPHPRFQTITRNIRLRRGSKVNIKVPVFVDSATADTFPVWPEERICSNSLCDPDDVDDDHAFDKPSDVARSSTSQIYMDCTAFGMGLSCLQVTLQAKNVAEARYLYDQLAVLAPIFLALTASTPGIKGLLADTDVRWDIISASVDDRTPQERREGFIRKSRYSSIDCFISDREDIDLEKYNDVPVAVNGEVLAILKDAGIDDRLAQHVAHLFIRDPLVIYEEMLYQDNTSSTDHFENIQSTNWNTVRFKLPPPDSDIGWRTEFRPMEVQLTDFENAAFSIFIVLVSRVILAFNLNLYTPMSLVEENMKTAHERNAVVEGKFFFRNNIFQKAGKRPESFICSEGHVHHPNFSFYIGHDPTEEPNETDLYTIDEIINGKPLSVGDEKYGFAFPGLLPLVEGYMDSMDLSPGFKSRMNKYFALICGRASGQLWTSAKWMRHYIMEHPDYHHDSIISDRIQYDLINACRDLELRPGSPAGRKMFGEDLANYLNARGPDCCGAVSNDIDCLAILRSKSEAEAVSLRGDSYTPSWADRAIRRIVEK